MKQISVTTPLDIKSKAGNLHNFTFLAGIEDTMTGSENFLQLSVMEPASFLMEKRTFERGNNRDRTAKVLKLKLGGEINFLSGSSFYLGGASLLFQKRR